ncbi:hypothetical protein WJX81_002202 [Elliptochloris bilobata]|uniref:C2H2-type domain-containing protein n=1 Tax=Elliptochloris bilobata TaxID=381761 RepID=A0AAW1RHE6_9CHLO
MSPPQEQCQAAEGTAAAAVLPGKDTDRDWLHMGDPFAGMQQGLLPSSSALAVLQAAWPQNGFSPASSEDAPVPLGRLPTASVGQPVGGGAGLGFGLAFAPMESPESALAQQRLEQMGALLASYRSSPLVPEGREAQLLGELTIAGALQDLMHRMLLSEPQAAEPACRAQSNQAGLATSTGQPLGAQLPGQASAGQWTAQQQQLQAAPAPVQLSAPPRMYDQAPQAQQLGLQQANQWPPQAQVGAPHGHEAAPWQRPLMQRRALVPAQPKPRVPSSHSFPCDVCGITCCGRANFEQHCACKKHLRKDAIAAAAAAAADGSGGPLYEPGTCSESEREHQASLGVLQEQCRSYCKQVITTELNKAVDRLLKTLLTWQEREKIANPLHAASHKRVLSGLREVAKAVRSRKACSVIMAPNIEQDEDEGRLDGLLAGLLHQAGHFGIPIVYALSRKKLGLAFGCPKRVSAIAILDYSGAEDQ